MGQWGKAKCLWENPSNCQLPFLSFFFPNHLFLPECGGVSYCMEWEEYGKKFELGREPFFWMPKNVCHSAMHPCFSIFHDHSPSRWGFWEQLEFFLCFSFHVFGGWLHFSHGWEVVFVVLGIGLFSSRFGSCWCIFHSRFLQHHVFLPWLWRAIHVFGCLTDYWSHAQAIWDVFPCCELCSLFLLWGCCLPHVFVLAVASKFVWGHCGMPICWLCSPLSMLGVCLPFVWGCA